MSKKTLAWVLIIIILAVAGILIAKNHSTNEVMDADNDGDEAAMQADQNTQATPADTSSSTVSADVSVGNGPVKEFTVTGSNFKFAPSTLTVKKGDTVKITFVNSGGFHDWRLDGYNVGTKQIKGGTQDTVTFVADKAGTFEYYCSVGDHRQMGMKGTLTVTE